MEMYRVKHCLNIRGAETIDDNTSISLTFVDGDMFLFMVEGQAIVDDESMDIFVFKYTCDWQIF